MVELDWTSGQEVVCAMGARLGLDRDSGMGRTQQKGAPWVYRKGNWIARVV